MRSALNLELPEPEWITLLREQQGFERGWIVGQLRGEDGCAHAVGGVREGGVGAARHADIIPEHTT